MTAKATHKQPRSLVEFVRAKKRAGCKVCALPEAIRVELTGARTKKIPRAEQIEWLATDHHITVTSAEFDAHYSGKHDQ